VGPPLSTRHAAVVGSAFRLGSLGGNVTLASAWRGRAGDAACRANARRFMCSDPEVAMREKVRRRPTRQTARPAGQRLQLTAVVERDRAGYVATCPQLQGCYTQGRTYEEVMRNIRDAIRLHLEDRLAVGEPLPVAGEVSLAVLDVAV
jgi:predicted RNase H-like HicB family nuclease